MRTSFLPFLLWGVAIGGLWSSRSALAAEAGDMAWFTISPSVSQRAVTVAIDFQAGTGILGWNFGLVHDPRAARIAEMRMAPLLAAVNDGQPPSFYSSEITSDPYDPSRAGVVQAAIISQGEPRVLPWLDGGFPVLEVDYDVMEECTIAIGGGLKGQGKPVDIALTFAGESEPYLPLTPAESRLAPRDIPAWFAISPSLSEGPVTVSIDFAGGVAVRGWSFGLCADGELAQISSYAPAPELAAVNGGTPPEFLRCEEDGGGGITQSVVLSTTEPVALPFRYGGLPVLHVSYRVAGMTSVSVCRALEASGETVPASLSIDGWPYFPRFLPSTRLSPEVPEAWFNLSPATSDGKVTVSIEFANSEVQGWSFGVCHDAAKASIARWRLNPALATILDGNPPEFYFNERAWDADPPRAGIVQAVLLSFYEYRYLPALTGGFPVLELEYAVQEETSISICDGLQGKGRPVNSVLTIFGRTFHPARPAGADLIVKAYASKMAFKAEPPESGEVVTVKLYTADLPVEGWSFALCNTARSSEVTEMVEAPEVEEILGGRPPDFILTEKVEAGPYVAVRQSVVLGPPVIMEPPFEEEPLAIGPFPQGLPLLRVRYRVIEEDSLKFCDLAGGISFDNRVAVEGVKYVPATRSPARLVKGALGTRFVRGDADLNGRLEITDVLVVLGGLFLGGSIPCLDAADANDVGPLDITDPIFILRYLYLGGPAPPLPFPEPGEDLSPRADLGCERGM